MLQLRAKKDRTRPRDKKRKRKSVFSSGEKDQRRLRREQEARDWRIEGVFRGVARAAWLPGGSVSAVRVQSIKEARPARNCLGFICRHGTLRTRFVLFSSLLFSFSICSAAGVLCAYQASGNLPLRLSAPLTDCPLTNDRMPLQEYAWHLGPRSDSAREHGSFTVMGLAALAAAIFLEIAAWMDGVCIDRRYCHFVRLGMIVR